MSPPSRPSTVGIYELRVHGLLGPLILSSLPHTAATRVRRHSVLIVDASDERDLAEMVRLIVGAGGEVESIRVVAHNSSGASRAPHDRGGFIPNG